MVIRHAMLVMFLMPVLASGAVAQGMQRCEREFRRCAAECGPGGAGPCTQACYTERAMCIQNPSRPAPQPPR
jgi:hypothetical protein